MSVSERKGEKKAGGEMTNRAMALSTFIPFQKIRHSTDKKQNKILMKADLQEHEWVATEKIHGCNFSFYCSGDTVRCARRRGLLKEGEKFVLGYEKVVKTTSPLVKKLYHILNKKHPIERCIVYGELFGGAYNHPDVNHNTNVKRVQKAKFPLISKAVQRGKLEELKQFDVENFISTIPKILGLPPPKCKNIAEGLVLRLAKEVPSSVVVDRPILKRKSKAFAEVARAPKLSRSPSPKSQNGRGSSEESKEKRYLEIERMRSDFVRYPEIKHDKRAIEAWKDLRRYVVENRLRSVMSKLVGQINKQKDLEMVAVELANDAHEDFLLDSNNKGESNCAIFNGLDLASQKIIIKLCLKEATNLVSKNGPAILKNKF
ncbi:hypothetical protein AAMO2058_001029600 [Amorphochlora amoebiformis]